MEKIKTDFLDRIDNMKSANDLKEIKNEFLSKNGKVAALMKTIKDLSIEDRKILNELKVYIENVVVKMENEFKNKNIQEVLEKSYEDITLPVRKNEIGGIHPLTKTIKELEDIFYNMGFSIANGFEIEDDWHNFSAVNMPPNHPARQMQDTFFLPNDYILRTQTIAISVREMERKKPPYKFVALGKTYRVEMDTTHSPMFFQIELQYIDKNVSLGNLKYIVIEFCKRFFEIKNLNVRFRPSHFPFSSPSFEVDMSCTKENGKIIKFGEGNDWCELGGSGFTHPNMIRNVNMDPSEWQGIAFGFGLERMAMLKYGISDIRQLYEGDLRFLKHYAFNYYE
ncbi:MAG: phenylalanine--tRNA ligase subunit alpha [Rickettsiales bacterium]|jgi:phenylalanyl-tRNA synthetase alpha chain|nr:phenylalanine--tRNA ligase subunit alpha [Rickettsiales bacterium]